MDSMRMDPNGNNLVCRNCLERKNPPGQPQSQSSSKFFSPSTKAQAKHQGGSTEMTEYFCKECRYNFKRASHVTVSNCPYCGSTGTVTEKGSTAKIFSDASRMK